MSHGPMTGGRGVGSVAGVRALGRSFSTAADGGGAPRLPAGPPTDLETYVFGLAALGAATVTLAVDSHAPTTVALLVLALLPWALMVAAVRLPLWVFVAGTIIPAAALIIRVDGGAPVFFGMFAATRVASVTGRRGPIIGAVVAAAALPVLFVLNTPDGPPGRAAYFSLGIVGSALLGALLHHQRRLAAELEWSQQRLRDAAAAEERRRIARDGHDALAHSLTVVVVNVAGARRALATHPDLADEALHRAERIGRDSLDSIRRVVGLLRPDAGTAGDGPGPDAADLRTIVTTHLEAGIDVRLCVSGDLDAVGLLAASALARIVQEALTNAGRHAAGAPIEVRVEVDDEHVVLNVTNGPPTEPPLDADGGRRGLGLVSMRERSEALGGDFQAGPTLDGGWRISCAVPLPPRPATGAAGQR
jgi:signal transduction histidine kinase